jgi:hypothetical protein
MDLPPSEIVVSFAEEEKTLARVIFDGNTDAKTLVQMLNGRGIYIKEFQEFLASNSNKKQIADLFFDKQNTSYNLYTSHLIADFLSFYIDR